MIPITTPFVGEAEAEAARAVVVSGWLTQGRQVAAFESEFATEVGAPYACAVSSCTAALHLALLAVGVGPGDEVVTVSHSFIATANSVVCCGAIPVFVDIDPHTYNIDPERVAAAVTVRTRAILCVHQMGMPCDLSRILEVGRACGLPVVEDAACAIGSDIRIDCGAWERIGRPHGDIACFSFHPRKIITTGDGGMLTTSNPEYDRLFRLWRQHGMNIDDRVRHSASRVVFENYPIRGFNYRLTDVAAAIGRQQLRSLPEILQRRRRLAAAYSERLRGLADVQPPEQPKWARSNWQSYCVRLEGGARRQQTVMQSMLDQGVATRRGIMCAHMESAYADLPQRWPLPRSEAARDECILLPLYPQMTDADQDLVVEALERALGNSARRRTSMASSSTAN
jgi:perosamine synthetase